MAAAKSLFAFERFPSFSNPNEKVLAYLLAAAPEVYNTAEFESTLKVHGCSTSITYDFSGPSGQPRSRLASRSQFLGGDANFHGIGGVYAKYTGALDAVVADIRSSLPAARVQVHGELFGGMYPGVATKCEGAVMGVNQVYYAPIRDVRFFDLFVDGQKIQRDEMRALFTKHGVPHLPVRRRGTLAELLAASPIFPDPLHLEYGLPTLPGNDAEGEVLQPIVPVLLPNGEYFMIKNKHPRHKEVGAAPAAKKEQGAVAAGSSSSLSQDIIDYYLAHLTEARLGSVLSKRPDGITDLIAMKADKKLRATVTHALVSDAIEDAIKNAPDDAHRDAPKTHAIKLRAVLFPRAQLLLV